MTRKPATMAWVMKPQLSAVLQRQGLRQMHASRHSAICGKGGVVGDGGTEYKVKASGRTHN